MRNEEYKNKIFQHSIINALAVGIYNGNVTIKELSNYGNLGLGTFNHLDGEMVALDGEFYKVKATDLPSVVRVPLDEKIPFAAVTHFNPNIPMIPPPRVSLNFKQLQDYIDGMLTPENVFYAFRMAGNFKSIRTRSVPCQIGPNYPRLIEVIEHQAEYNFKNIEGFLVGFWFPFYMRNINVPGYHFHFLSEDKTRGGHLFECQTDRLEIKAARILAFQMILPDREEFERTDLNVTEEELEIIEKGKGRNET